MNKYEILGITLLFWLMLFSLLSYANYSMALNTYYNEENTDFSDVDLTDYSQMDYIFGLLFWNLPESFELPFWVHIFFDFMAIFPFIVILIILYPFAN